MSSSAVTLHRLRPKIFGATRLYTLFFRQGQRIRFLAAAGTLRRAGCLVRYKESIRIFARPAPNEGAARENKREVKLVQFAIFSKTDDSDRLDRVSLTLAAVLFLSPWALGFSDIAMAARTAWVGGILLALVSALATRHFSEWEEWVNLAVGVGLIAAPWVLKFRSAGDAVGVFTGVGIIIATIALAEIWGEHHRGEKT
jgi:hypothetical protein